MMRTLRKKPRVDLTPYCIGAKLKMLRTEKGLTLSRLGAEVGLSSALLSKVESEVMIPTIPTLLRVCRVYGVDLGFFFSIGQQHSLSITRKAHISVDRRDLPRAKELPLHHSTPITRQVSRIVEIPAEASSTSGTQGSGQSSPPTCLKAHFTCLVPRKKCSTAETALCSTRTPQSRGAPPKAAAGYSPSLPDTP